MLVWLIKINEDIVEVNCVGLVNRWDHLLHCALPYINIHLKFWSKTAQVFKCKFLLVQVSGGVAFA